MPLPVCQMLLYSLCFANTNELHAVSHMKLVGYSKHYKTSGWQEPGKLKRFPFRNVCAYMSLAFDAQKPSSIHILNNFITCHLVTCRQNILLFSKTFFFFERIIQLFIQHQLSSHLEEQNNAHEGWVF